MIGISTRARNRRAGFSLLELIVVLGILVLLTGLTLTGVQAARQNAARASCQSRLRELGIACHNFHAAHGAYPRGVWYPHAKSQFEKDAVHAGIAWQTSLLPYLERDALWHRVAAAHATQPSGNSVDHDRVAAEIVTPFRCPADARTQGGYQSATETWTWGLNNYLGVAGTGLKIDDGIFHADLSVAATAVTDGTSSTLLIGERPTGPNGAGSSWYCNWGTMRYFDGQILAVDERWANANVRSAFNCPPHMSVFQPGHYDNACFHGLYWSLHPGGANFAFADGSVRFLRYSANDVLPALATRAGGETATVPD